MQNAGRCANGTISTINRQFIHSSKASILIVCAPFVFEETFRSRKVCYLARYSGTQNSYTVQLYGTGIRYSYTVQLYGTVMRYSYTVQLYGTVKRHGTGHNGNQSKTAGVGEASAAPRRECFFQGFSPVTTPPVSWIRTFSESRALSQVLFEFSWVGSGRVGSGDF